MHSSGNQNGGGGGAPTAAPLVLCSVDSRGYRTYGYGSCAGIAPPSPSCPSGYTLSNGSCIPPVSPWAPSCPSGYTLSSGQCYASTSCSVTGFLWTSRTVCSGIPFSCPAGQSLIGGSCRATVSPSCPSGFTYANGSCQAGATPLTAKPAVSIKAVPNIVRSGNSTHLTWDGGIATECAITGTDGFSSHAVSDNTTISSVTEQRVYTITCDQNGGPSASASTTVNILPMWSEFWGGG